MNATATTTPRIYVASLSDYNDGRLHGVWIDATDDVDEIRQQIDDMLASSPIPGAEEYAIHDHEGFEGYEVGEYDSIETVARIATMIEEHGRPFIVWLNYRGDIDDACATFDDAYQGTWRSAADYAEDLLFELEQSEVPEHLRPYFDYEKYARDLELGGDIITHNEHVDEVYVFWANV